MRALAHFCASVMMVSGTLLLADAAATLLWQEPVSYVLAGRQQAELEDAFARPPPRGAQRKPLPGDAVAKISIPAIELSRYVVEGTDSANLRKGPGHYPETPLPGRRGTVAIAGHRTTYGAPFRNLDKLDRGDRITVDTPTGRYLYRVERNRIVEPTDRWVLRRVAYDRLVLTACHPLYSAAQRIVTFARFVRRTP